MQSLTAKKGDVKSNPTVALLCALLKAPCAPSSLTLCGDCIAMSGVINGMDEQPTSRVADKATINFIKLDFFITANDTALICNRISNTEA